MPLGNMTTFEGGLCGLTGFVAGVGTGTLLGGAGGGAYTVI